MGSPTRGQCAVELKAVASQVQYGRFDILVGLSIAFGIGYLGRDLFRGWPEVQGSPMDIISICRHMPDGYLTSSILLRLEMRRVSSRAETESSSAPLLHADAYRHVSAGLAARLACWTHS